MTGAIIISDDLVICVKSLNLTRQKKKIANDALHALGSCSKRFLIFNGNPLHNSPCPCLRSLKTVSSITGNYCIARSRFLFPALCFLQGNAQTFCVAC